MLKVAIPQYAAWWLSYLCAAEGSEVKGLVTLTLHWWAPAPNAVHVILGGSLVLTLGHVAYVTVGKQLCTHAVVGDNTAAARQSRGWFSTHSHVAAK